MSEYQLDLAVLMVSTWRSHSSKEDKCLTQVCRCNQVLRNTFHLTLLAEIIIDVSTKSHFDLPYRILTIRF